MGSEDQALTVQSKKSRSSPLRSKYSHHRNRVSTLIIGITLKILEIGISTFYIHVMKEDTLLEILLKTKVALTRRRTTKEDIMLTLQRMRNLPGREPEKKVKILQAMKSMF